MSEKNYWLKNGFMNLIQNFAGVFFGFFSFYMLIRMLSKDDYGLWVIFLSITGIVEMAKNGFTQEATIKYMSSATENERRKIATASFISNSIITGIILLVLSFTIPLFGKIWHSEEIIKMLYIYMIVFVTTIFLSVFNYIEQSNLRFNGVVAAAVIRQFLFFCYILYCYISNIDITLISLVIAQVTNVLIATGIAYLFTRKYINFSLKIDRGWIKRIFNFGKYSFGVSLTSIISGSIDQMMLGSMVSKSASGSFNVAVRVTNLTDIPANSIASIVFPQSSKRFEQDGDSSIKYIYEKSVGVILSILIPILLFLYLGLDPILLFIAGEKYQGALPLLKIILAGTIISPFGRQAGTVLAASGRSKINFYLMLMATALVIIFNLLLIKPYGVIGAAVASVSAGLVHFGISQLVLKKYFNISIKNVFIYSFYFYKEFYNKYLLKK